MKELINKISSFYKIAVIDEENIAIHTPFLLLDTDRTYPINIKKMKNNYYIHDAGALIDFINEEELELDKDYIEALTEEYSKLLISDDDVLIYQTEPETLVFDLACFIQIITKIVG